MPNAEELAAHAMESVDLVDKLMLQYRNKVKPSDADIVRAHDLGINTTALRIYVEESSEEIAKEYGWNGDGE